MGACCDSEQQPVKKEIDLANTNNTNTSQGSDKKVYASNDSEQQPLKKEIKPEPKKQPPPQETRQNEPAKQEVKPKPTKSVETSAPETYEKEEQKTEEKEEKKEEEIPMEEIKNIDVIDPENKIKSIYEAFTDNNKYFDLRNPFTFILDLGKGSQLTKMEIKYHSRYSSDEITIYASYTNDINDNWNQIGELKLNEKPGYNAIVTINNINNYSNRRYIKIVFGGEFYSKSHININRFHFYGITGITRQIITDKMSVLDVSGVRNNDITYGYERMFNENDRECWETPKDFEHWIIFDTHGYIISKIYIQFWSSTYACNSIEIYEGNDLQNGFERIKEYDWIFKTEKNRKNEHQVLPKQSITFDMNELCTLVKHKRLIKLKFIHKEEESVNVKFLKIYGELGEKGELNDGKFLYNWQEMKDENESKFEQDENAIDVTHSHLIKILETFPKTEDKNKRKFKNMYRPELNYYWDKRLDNNKKDIWLKFDMGAIKIDSFDISLYERYHAKIIKVYTSKTNSNMDNDWNLIKIKRDIAEKEMKKFYLKSDHERYIKIAFGDRVSNGYVGVNRLKWIGFEPVVEDEITNKIKIYQCSGKTDECKMVLKNSLDSWKSATGEKAWIIFDCGKYELDRLSITFAEKCKPEMVKLRMSDVAPVYSFKIASIMKWKLNTTQSWEDKEWQDIVLVEDLTLSGHEYEKIGFKRYVQLEFSKFQSNEIQIIKIQFFGNLSEIILDINDEQFDSVLDADDGELKNQDCNAPYKPEFVDSSATTQ
eukprot:493942_1